MWESARSPEELKANLAALPGFGEMKVKSLGAVLAKRFGVELAAPLVPPHPTLGDVDSPQALEEYQAAKRLHKAQWSAGKRLRAVAAGARSAAHAARSRVGDVAVRRRAAAARARAAGGRGAASPRRGRRRFVRCARRDDDYLWVDDTWRLWAPPEPTGLPMVVLLKTRAHVDFHELPAKDAAELGPLLQRVQRAVAAIDGVGNVHVCRWGDGSEHFHFWFMARPARMPQLIGSFAAIWDDVLPPTPNDVWAANLAAVRAALDSIAFSSDTCFHWRMDELLTRRRLLALGSRCRSARGSSTSSTPPPRPPRSRRPPRATTTRPRRRRRGRTSRRARRCAARCGRRA